MTRSVPQTSRDAYHQLDTIDTHHLKRRILSATLHRADTSLLLAHRLGIDYASVEKRCSDLLNTNHLQKVGTKRNPTGRSAAILQPTPRGIAWLNRGDDE